MTEELQNWDRYLRPALKQVNDRVLKLERFSPCEVLFGFAKENASPLFLQSTRPEGTVPESGDNREEREGNNLSDAFSLMVYRSQMREASREIRKKKRGVGHIKQTPPYSASVNRNTRGSCNPDTEVLFESAVQQVKGLLPITFDIWMTMSSLCPYTTMTLSRSPPVQAISPA